MRPQILQRVPRGASAAQPAIPDALPSATRAASATGFWRRRPRGGRSCSGGGSRSIATASRTSELTLTPRLSASSFQAASSSSRHRTRSVAVSFSVATTEAIVATKLVPRSPPNDPRSERDRGCEGIWGMRGDLGDAWLGLLLRALRRRVGRLRIGSSRLGGAAGSSPLHVVLTVGGTAIRGVC